MSVRRHVSISKTDGTPVSLFPFLAVLICTMGALIVLLVVMARQMRLEAIQSVTSTEPTLSVDEIRKLGEELDWQIEALTASKEHTEKQLADARRLLGHAEQHIRELREEVVRLEAELKRPPQHSDSFTLEELEAKAARLEEAVAKAEAELAEARRKARERSYAVIPFDGKYGTRRIPIYLECRSDAVILQPEGIRFTVSDFSGPLGPGNPLDAALRAVREYLMQSGRFDSSQGEPYPLLLVRPDGIAGYYAARAAMTSWGSEFGYELIEADWDLAFPAPDPRLAELVVTTVAEARFRQKLLARAAPRKYGRSGGASESVADENAFPTFSAPIEAERSRSPSGEYAEVAESASEIRPPVGSALAADAPATGGTRLSPPNAANSNEGQPNRTWAGETPKHGVAVGGSVRPLARTRGENWGLPDHTADGIPVTRPVRVDCYPDKLVIVPDTPGAAPVEIEVRGSLEPSMDRLASALWNIMDGWGIAGYGMYWKPVLAVRIAPGAESRYEELKILLEDSGLAVEQSRSSPR
ncbi:hypothetical protein JCM19992_13030 [Thermostilla marina]